MSEPSITERLAAQRHQMLETQLRARGIQDSRILQAMERVPRHEFVDPAYQNEAYEDHPLPIGMGQTISQPYIVGLMLQWLAVQQNHKVLEVGTGSGYLTAILAELARQVYSIERYTVLAERARQTLSRLGYSNTVIVVGDGSEGLPRFSPYDAIIVSAAAPGIPSALIDQLAEGGRMIIPVGPADTQELELVRREGGALNARKLEACRFVPLIGDQGFQPT